MPKIVVDKDGQEHDLDAIIKGYIASKGGGDAGKALEVLVEENYNYRRRLETAEKENVELKKSRPEGSMLLTAEQAKAWEEYQKLGKPEDITKKVTERNEFETKYTDLQRDQLIRDASAASSFKHNVLGDLVKAKNLDLVMGETEVDDGKGGKTKQPAAFVKDANGQQKPLTDVVKEQFPDYVPSLQLNGQQQPTGTPWVNQSPTGGQGTPTQSGAKDYIKSQYGHNLETPAGAGAGAK